MGGRMEIIMKLLFMGTGAADWGIKNRVGDEFFRRFTSIMINNDLMIDCNDETLDFIEKNGCDTSNVRNLLITHTHDDHYSVSAINRLFGNDITLFCDKGAVAAQERLKAVQRVIPLYTPTRVGKYEVIAAAANHSVANSAEQPLNYIISDGEKRMFWGCDGAWLLNGTWHEMKKYKYDLIVLDGTLGTDEGDYRIFEHNNLRMITEMSATFRKLKLLNEGGKIMISHMSRQAHKSHDELGAYLEKYDITAAFDGLEINF